MSIIVFYISIQVIGLNSTVATRSVHLLYIFEQYSYEESIAKDHQALKLIKRGEEKSAN